MTATEFAPRTNPAFLPRFSPLRPPHRGRSDFGRACWDRGPSPDAHRHVDVAGLEQVAYAGAMDTLSTQPLGNDVLREEYAQPGERFVDASIAKTLNIPDHCRYEDFEPAYLHAWRCGLKGITGVRPSPVRNGSLHAGWAAHRRRG
jgi:hypothetical protein